jgi:hypothetical protein
VTGICPQYGGSVDVINYVVENKDAIEYISSYWKVKDTVQIWGNIHFTSKTEKKTKNVGFGEPVETSETVSINELVITSGSPCALDGEQSYDDAQELITTALANRQLKLDKMKEKKASTSTAKSSSATTKYPGF